MPSLQDRFNQLVASHSQTKKTSWGATAAAPTNTSLTSEAVDLILAEAVRTRASDIHVEPYQDVLRIRFRIDGKLYEVLSVEPNANITIIARIKILANMPIDAISSRKPMDGRFSTKVGPQEFDFRIATFPTLMGEKIALRILNKNFGIANIKKIGLNDDDALKLEKIIKRKSGLLVVSGPTGSGKTTTLYSILSRLHSPHVNIVTLEDPVEYQINGINQCDIKKKGDDTFATGLKAILRQDPDVVLIGEIRDTETAEITIRASLTGHLVLTSLHANSAIGTAIRLINMGLERYMVSYALIGAVAQRLVPRLCQACRAPYTISANSFKGICEQYGLSAESFAATKAASEGGLQYVQDDPAEETVPGSLTLYKNIGCPACNGTGYDGRMGIFEVVFFTDELRDAIVRNAPTKELEAIATRKGFRSLAVDAIEKAKAGHVTMEDIYPILLERAV